MRKCFDWRFVVLMATAITVLLTACDTVETGTPTADTDEAAVLTVPTRTLGPIVSFTPRFTATPIPSLTYTPSLTPVPSDTPNPPTLTPTLTLTPTPTVSGAVRSTENVNLREGPGTDYPIAFSVPPGTDLGVVGIQTDADGREWYKVAYEDEDGTIRYLWVYARLIETDFKEIVGYVTPAPTSAQPTASGPTPTPVPNRVNILAYCRQKGVRPPQPTTNDNVFIEWSWFVAHPRFMEPHLQNAHYEVRLDGELLEDWQRYATDMKLESGVWIVYWYYPVGKLSAGEHTVTFHLTWDEAITDGYTQFGPGTANPSDDGDCTFTVVEAE